MSLVVCLTSRNCLSVIIFSHHVCWHHSCDAFGIESKIIIWLVELCGKTAHVGDHIIITLMNSHDKKLSYDAWGGGMPSKRIELRGCWFYV